MDEFDKYDKVSKVAGKASGIFTLVMIFGCLLPIIVICLGALFTQN